MQKMKSFVSFRYFIPVAIIALFAMIFTPLGRYATASVRAEANRISSRLFRKPSPKLLHSRVDAAKVSPMRSEIVKRLEGGKRLTVELFVMSQCPFGVRAEEAIAPIIDEFGDQIDFKLRFIAAPDGNGFKSMHGQAEVDEDIRQALMAEKYPVQYLDYVVARSADYRNANWQPVAKAIGIDVAEIERLSASPYAKTVFADNVKRANELKINASPTVLIDGVAYKGMVMPPNSKAASCNVPDSAAAKVANEPPPAQVCTTNADCVSTNLCLTNGSCVSGMCSYTAINCDDHNACTIDACDASTGKCVNQAISCDDNNPCTIDTCDSLTGCRFVPKSCDDHNPNTVDSCDVIKGCVNTPICNTPISITDNPKDTTAFAGLSAQFVVSFTGNPTPTVQWQVSRDNGVTWTDIDKIANPTAASNSLLLNPVSLSDAGSKYRAVITNGCGTVNTTVATLSVTNFTSKFVDPLVCVTGGNLVTITATLTNLTPNMVNASYSLPVFPAALTGVPGSGTATVNPAGMIVTPTDANWTGSLAPGQSVDLSFKAVLGPNVVIGQQICIASNAIIGGVPQQPQTPCMTAGCPQGANPVLVSDQKPGSVLVFPYYTSGAGADTRITISNINNLAATPQNPNYTFVHLMLIDGATCQQADQYVCLTPNASLSFKAGEFDPGITGWVLAVAVDQQGIPVKNNVLLGNAFVSDGTYQDNYGAETFAANKAPLAAVNAGAAQLFFDGIAYDSVPRQFSIEVQSPLDAAGQKVVTVGLNGVVGSQMTGASQVGTGQIINGKESPVGSFTGFLTGTCQAISTISGTNPRVTLGMNKLIPSNQSGTMIFNVGSGVGLLMTPKASKFGGIRLLHKTQVTSAIITIPIFVPSC